MNLPYLKSVLLLSKSALLKPIDEPFTYFNLFLRGGRMRHFRAFIMSVAAISILGGTLNAATITDNWYPSNAGLIRAIPGYVEVVDLGVTGITPTTPIALFTLQGDDNTFFQIDLSGTEGKKALYTLVLSAKAGSIPIQVAVASSGKNSSGFYVVTRICAVY
jgi:hypothetical protein